MSSKHCIYQILNKDNGKRYIGRTCQFEKRKYTHFRKLEVGNHHSRYLQRAYDNAGPDSFVMVPLCGGLSFEEAQDLEQLVLDSCYDELYNCSKSAFSPMVLGDKHTEETKTKMSAARKGKTLTEEHKAKIGEAQTGRMHTKETKAKIAAAKKGAKNHQYAPFIVRFPDGRVDRWKTTGAAASAYGVGVMTVWNYLNGKTTPGKRSESAHLLGTIWQYL